MAKDTSHVAYFEEADDGAGSEVGVIEGTRKYARSENVPSAQKERPNTGKSRASRRSSPLTSSGSSLVDSEDEPEPQPSESRRASRRHTQKPTVDPRTRDVRRREKPPREEEARPRSSKSGEPSTRSRPTSLKHAATQPGHPVIRQEAYRRGHVEDPTFYGVQQPAVSGSRPRAKTRPASYYAGQVGTAPYMGAGGVPSMSAHPPQAPMPFPVGTFPPPQLYPAASPSFHGGLPPTSGHNPGYFDIASGPQSHAHLRSRFDVRPSSALDFHKTTPIMTPHHQHHHQYDSRGMPPPQQHSGSRRLSVSRTKKESDDRRKMPPPGFVPARPQSAALPPLSAPFRPPPPHPQHRHQERPTSRHQSSRPPTSHRRSVGFADDPRGYDDEDFRGTDGLFHDISPQPSYEQRLQSIARTRRALALQDDDSAEDDDGTDTYDLVPVKSQSRRSSMHGHHALGTGGVSLEEERYLDALRYQDEVTGGPKVPLTAETLRRATRPRGVASSRSTRSSASRDESDYRRSNTTGITRASSGAGPDDVTIKFSAGGGALVTMGNGAEVDVAGGEIRFRSRPSGSRSGSDQNSSMYQLEDSKSRYERKALPHRTRTPSQSESRSRSYYPSGHAPYEPGLAADNYI